MFLLLKIAESLAAQGFRKQKEVKLLFSFRLLPLRRLRCSCLNTFKQTLYSGKTNALKTKAIYLHLPRYLFEGHSNRDNYPRYCAVQADKG